MFLCRRCLLVSGNSVYSRSLLSMMTFKRVANSSETLTNFFQWLKNGGAPRDWIMRFTVQRVSLIFLQTPCRISSTLVIGSLRTWSHSFWGNWADSTCHCSATKRKISASVQVNPEKSGIKSVLPLNLRFISFCQSFNLELLSNNINR